MKKLLLTGLLFASCVALKAQNCTELFFSEYVEGTGNNKALEVYNPTASIVALSNYRIVRYSNGSATGTDSTDLVGAILPYDVFVLVNGQTTGTPTSPACDPNLQALADQLDGAYPVPTYANGDDAICLVRKNPYKIVDIFGKIGEDPGTAWDDVFPFNSGTGSWLTANHTLRRLYSVQTGVTSNPAAFDTFMEYDSLPNNTWTGLGVHQCACGTIGLKSTDNTSKFVVFPNPSNGSELNIVTQGNENTITIFNAMGQALVERKTISTNEVVTLKDLSLPAGIYLIEVKNTITGIKSNKKIVIQ